MTPDTPAQITKALVSIDTKILALVYDDLAKPGVQQVGKALSTVLGLGNTVLLPLKLANEKAQMWYAKHMEQYRLQLENTPEEKIVEVAPEIGVPILENLEKTTNEKISELYINLLSNASSIDFVTNTHPRFVSIIESLTHDEVTILEQLEKLEVLGFINIEESINVKDVSVGSGIPLPLPSDTCTTVTNKQATMYEKLSILSLPSKSKFYFNNLQGLNLVEADAESFSVGINYQYIIDAFDEEIKNTGPNITHTTVMGYYQLTEFGKLFLKACKAQPKT